MMRNMASLAILCGALVACAGPPPAPGTPLADVRVRLGQPTARYDLGGGDTELEYATGPWGQQTWMARFGPDQRLLSYQQVLDANTFAKIMYGKSTKQDVLHLIGRPAETMFLPRQQLEVWTYRYKEANVWNSMMHVHFDTGGVVRMLMNGPDEWMDERRLF
jgi:hypothetical protein